MTEGKTIQGKWWVGQVLLCVLHPFVVVGHAASGLLLAPVIQAGTFPAQEAPAAGQVQKPNPLTTSRTEEKGLLAAVAVALVGKPDFVSIRMDYFTKIFFLVDIQIFSSTE